MIGIIGYGAGNIRSVRNALDRIGAESFVSSDTSELATADRLILPGVGSAKPAVERLRAAGLFEWVRSTRLPLLGVCLGMQMLHERSEEQSTDCLGFVPGTVRKFDDRAVRVPHTGWNRVDHNGTDRLFEGIPSGTHFYFVHSYFAPMGDYTIASSENGCVFSAAVGRDNVRGVQFHPEKSAEAGLRVLRNFVTTSGE